MDEAHVKFRGRWANLYRALDEFAEMIDIFLSANRNPKGAKRFLGKALKGWKDWKLPEVLNTDKAPTYAAAIADRKGLAQPIPARDLMGKCRAAVLGLT